MALRRYILAAALGLLAAHPLWGQEPGRIGLDAGKAVAPQQVSLNQQVANTIADSLRQSGQLRRYTIDVAFQGGTAELTGSVADQPQREEALRIVQGVPGVERVVDHLAVAAAGAPITRVQAGAQPAPLKDPLPPPGAPPAANGGPPPEPAPIFQAGPPPYALNTPRMPPYAWPTYAPYNNYSRVAYPEAYPYQAWPFIGPVYPFPKVPLGWRSVKLEWQDGHWWFSKTATKHDWWRL
ncbi:MAG TPA: BON domain-containing protein, partial [Gemmataceae bacterium]|nr:BON domain-containing protein [Gemmataceae bacterium]